MTSRRGFFATLAAIIGGAVAGSVAGVAANGAAMARQYGPFPMRRWYTSATADALTHRVRYCGSTASLPVECRIERWHTPSPIVYFRSGPNAAWKRIVNDSAWVATTGSWQMMAAHPRRSLLSRILTGRT